MAKKKKQIKSQKPSAKDELATKNQTMYVAGGIAHELFKGMTQDDLKELKDILESYQP